MTPQLQTSSLRLECLHEDDQWVGFTLSVRDGDGWSLMAQTRPLSHLIYQDNKGNRQEVALVAQRCQATGDSIELHGEFSDVDGVTWQLSVTLALESRSDSVLASYRLAVTEERKLLRWLGPALHVGQGSFGAAKDEALFPGLEYLLDDEPSSDTRFAAAKYANRAVPHPYKITVPLMAVSHGGRSVGITWDPNQAWGSAWRHPAALFSSPNRLQDGADNHWLALFAPGPATRWLDEGEVEAHQPYGFGPGKLCTLSARLVALPGGCMDLLRAWVATNGLPPLPEPGLDYRQNVELIVRSFLDVAWNEEHEGWHHTLADPWGPRYEPHLANQLWRYGCWPEGDPTLRARAREQVRRAVARVRREAATGTWQVSGEQVRKYAPHLGLALVYGHVAGALDAVAADARQALAQLSDDGSWPWQPDIVADIADFKTEERLEVMGAQGESATGLTAMRMKPVLQYALATADQEAVAAVRRAADWCNGQRRPEGAQVWELHLHVPDVLAVPYLIDLNLGAYQFTGEEGYLEAANRWAWTGLPFTFLWNAYYRPVMRYGTLPVFGVTFHDVQSWFGVIVHWNGLVYADALSRLARFQATAGPIDWRHLAEGITRHGMQEQVQDGPYLGMYPDAFSTVKGDEEYTWWLNPQLVGLNSFPLAGLPVAAETRVLRRPTTADVADQVEALHVTSGAVIAQADLDADATLRLLLRHQPDAISYTLLAGRGRPTSVVCEGAVLPEVDDIDAAAQSWQWLPAHNSALVRVQHGRDIVALQCHYRARV